MKKYDVLIDWDTPIVSAAAVQQQTTVIAKHIKSGREKEFDNKTAFNKFLKENPKWVKEDFLLEDKIIVVGSVRQAVSGLMSKMYSLSEAPYIKSFKFGVGGSLGNFRDSIARIQPYKGQRPKKPVLFDKIKKELLLQVPQHIIQPSSNVEVDDVLSMFQYEMQSKGEDSDRAILFVDKDLKTVQGWCGSFKTYEKPLEYISKENAFKNLMHMSLVGDKADNIQGIPYQVESVLKKFNIKKSSGFGKASADKCLAGATTQEELIERVCFVYRETFKDGLLVNDPWEKLSWLQVLDENVQLLKMLDYEGQQYIFSKEFNIKEN